jgi:FkbM family methyltransferase
MIIKNRVNWVLSHISKMGLGLFAIYIFQRIFWRKGAKIYVKTNNTKKLGGFYLRNKTTDIETFYLIFIAEEFGKIKDVPFNSFLDLGGNIGLATLFFSSLRPDSRKLVLEPENENFTLLCKNTQSIKDLKTMKYAVSNITGKISLLDGGGNDSFFISAARQSDELCAEIVSTVDSIDINSLINEDNKFDIVKIDIEGSEGLLFLNTSWMKHIKICLIEIHDNFIPGLRDQILDKIPENFKVINGYCSVEYTLIIDEQYVSNNEIVLI